MKISRFLKQKFAIFLTGPSMMLYMSVNSLHLCHPGHYRHNTGFISVLAVTQRCQSTDLNQENRRLASSCLHIPLEF